MIWCSFLQQTASHNHQNLDESLIYTRNFPFQLKNAQEDRVCIKPKESNLLMTTLYI